MPSSAFLEVDLHCLQCHAVLSDVVWFQWGFCRASIPATQSLYRLGDDIRWHACPGGTIFPWTEFDDGTKGWGSNIGDPDVRNIVVRDNRQFGWERLEERRVCPQCALPVEGAVVEIRDGKIVDGRVYQPGEFDQRVTYYLLAGNEPPVPLPEWENHAMELRSPDCASWSDAAYAESG